MDIDDFCNDKEGWGPTSNSRPDLTLCVENTILLTLPSLIALIAISYRSFFLWQNGKSHNLGRANIIYWTTQFFMHASVAALIARAILLNQVDYTPAMMLSNICLILAWVSAIILNHIQSQKRIRSSNFIFTLYTITLTAAAINIRTMTMLNQTDENQFIAFVTYFGLNAAGFIVEAFPRGRTRVQKESGAGRYEKANLASRVLFHFLQPIISQGFKAPLTVKDIDGMMPERIKTKHSFDVLNNEWQKNVAKAKAKNQEPNLLWTVLSSNAWSWVPVIFHRIAASSMTYVLPVLMDKLLGFINSYSTPNPQPVGFGIILAFGMFFASMLNTFFMAQYFQTSINIGIEARSALIAMIYRKSLRLSSVARQKSTAGEINNHMSIDAERWTELSNFLPMVISTPIELAIALWLLYNQIGWSVFAGFGSIIAMMPIQGFIASLFMKAKAGKLKATDERTLLQPLVLSGIKIIKLYGWEDSFVRRIRVSRERELAMLKRIGTVFSFMSIMFQSMPLIVTLVSFSVYATVGGPNYTSGDINSQTVFVSISLLALLNRPIGMLSHIISVLVGATIATKRIQKFLLAEEIEGSNSEQIRTLPEDQSVPIIEIKDAVFAWEQEGSVIETEKEIKAREKQEAKKQKQFEKDALKSGKPVSKEEKPAEKDYSPTLVDINLAVTRGQLAAVVGRVGQGKSSLLSAIIGDMYKCQGIVTVYGRLSYVAQSAWIVNATLKDNITFGNTFDQERYDHILMACGLLPDIEMLPAGDMTEIGERGINLSGGQKQRVSLARAAYGDADVYLLDDPLSAVDAHVDQHLWEHLIGPNGLLKHKTRILVTNAIHHLEQADQIIVIKDRRISEVGKYDSLMETKNSFYQLITDYSVNKSKKRKGKNSGASDGDQADDISDVSTQDGIEKVAKPVVAKKDDKAELIADEHMAIGSVAKRVYMIYAKAASYTFSMMIVFLFVAGQALQIGTNIWLKYWTTGTSRHSVGGFLGIYAVLIVAYMFVNVTTTYITMVSAAVRASFRLHEQLLTRLVRLPMSFFDTTPLGRVVNRFSSDVYAVDELTPWCFISFFQFAVSVLGTIVVIATTTPVFLAIVPPLFAAYFVIQSVYMRTSRTLKRIDSVSKSPIYQHFSETLAGVTTIRVLAADERFINDSASKTDVAANAFFSWFVVNRWLQIRLESLGAIIVLAAALFAVFSRNSLSSANVGLALSYALNVTQDITWLVRAYCDLQNQLVAVERVDEYSSKNPEAPAETDIQLPESWPREGRVEFRNYSTRYREGLDTVLKNISVTVQPGEKVGIVGRTGAGKSSLTLALFRIVEAANGHWAKASHNGTDSDATLGKMEEMIKLEKVEVEEDGGSIWIDGIDISTVGLNHLRQNLAIIPQDPMLFIGTVRENLDPFDELEDVQLWEALERAHLKEHISSLAGGLSFKVSQNGDNFSVGQRSLICLARALLRKTKILVLDEATAAIDVETDELIQKTIRKEFNDRTILTIAHRIKTVMDSNKILVLEKGRISEFEAPSVLLQDPASLFYSLAKQAGEIKESD
ncbi:Multidrug resistance-associated protein 1 [Entomortierella beljakovae]|nr:Multidrug resistance-associated protein 1 [Entomortierella beljakovae]